MIGPKVQSPPSARNFAEGPLLWQLVCFSLPLFSSMLLQLTFHAADLIVVGRYASAQAMAAVGSTSALAHLFINVLLGLSTGAAVVAAQSFGAKDYARLDKAIHTAMLLAVLGGALMGGAGVLLARSMLRLMKAPEGIIDQSTLYMRIFLAGTPFLTLYNFGSAILRSLGDTRRPMLYLMVAGVVNVILNLVFVICFKMDVAGVALATMASQGLSALLVCLALRRGDAPYRLRLSGLRLHPQELRRILRIGLPSGFQGSLFTLSNVVIQSYVNSLGEIVVAGNAAVQSMEGLPYLGSYCFFHASLTFVGQNYGAKNLARIRRSILHSCWLGAVICLTIGLVLFIFGEQVLSIYKLTPEMMRFGLERMAILYTTYWLCSLMDTVSGSLRGLGYSFFPAVSILLSVCALRVAWCATVFRHYRTFASILCSYPLSWFLAALVNGIFLAWLLRRRVAAEFGNPCRQGG